MQLDKMLPYADVLLIHAEASIQAAGPTADGLKSLNMVHRRAYGMDPLQPSVVDFPAAVYTAKTFIDIVIKERGYFFKPASDDQWQAFSTDSLRPMASRN